MKKILALMAALLLPLTLASPAEAHVTVCDRATHYPVKDPNAFSRITALAEIHCPRDGHQSWVSVRVVIEERIDFMWYSLGQPDTRHNPSSAYAVAVTRCPSEGGSRLYRTYAVYKVGGDQGTRTYSHTTHGVRLC